MATFVLIPGAGGSAWYWHRVVPELGQRGHEALAVDLPAADDGAGLREYAETVLDVIGDRRDLIVVGQSMGAFVAPMVGARASVAKMVLLNPMIPAPSETPGDWWLATGQPDAQQEYLSGIGLTPRDAEDPAVLFFHDVPSDVAEVGLSGEPPQSGTPFGQPWPLRAWPDVPTHVLVGRDDRLFPEAFQRRVARERLGIEVDVIDGGHLVALSQPGAVVDRLEAYLER
jgi:pimeloyl-ACP methyl ester carboxylesterase